MARRLYPTMLMRQRSTTAVGQPGASATARRLVISTWRVRASARHRLTSCLYLMPGPSPPAQTSSFDLPSHSVPSTRFGAGSFARV